MLQSILVILLWFSFATLFYSYIGYGIIASFIIGLKNLIKRKRSAASAGMIPVTMIVTAYNEEAVIREKLDNLQSLDYPPDKLNIIIVTDGSEDETRKIVSSYPAIQLLHLEERKGKYAAIKRAVKYVKTPVIIFSDANSILNKKAIKQISLHYANPSIGGVAGEKKIIVTNEASAVGEGEGLYWKYESFMKKLDAGLNTVIGAAGELFSIRTELFKELPDELIIDDFIISMQVCLQGYKIAYEPGAFASELPSASLADEEKRKVRISAGAYQSIHYLKNALNVRQFPLLAFQFISRRILRWLFCPVMLIVFFVSSCLIVLTNNIPFYNFIFLLQLVFYSMAYIGWTLVRRTGKSGLFTVPFYFIFMNYCLVKGFIKYRKGSQTVLWEKSSREVAKAA